LKQHFILSGIIALLLLPFTFQAAEPVKVSPLDRDLEDVGCVFHRKKEKLGTNPLFISDSTGTWMNINDKTVQLTDLSEVDNDKYQEYKSGDVIIRIYNGKYRQHEGGVTYKNAKMTVTVGDKTETIKLTGGCGC
jgi:hypothetical protein